MKTITLPLAEFLDILWHSRSIANVDRHLADNIKSIDTDETFCHVEYPEDNARQGVGTPIKIPMVWRKNEWEINIINWTKEKLESDKRVAQRDAYVAKIQELTQAIQKAMPMLDIEACGSMARAIYQANNIPMAQHFGVARTIT
jgi:hypothetical protein